MLLRLSPNVRGCLFMIIAMFGFTANDLFVKFLGKSLPVFEIIAIRGSFVVGFLFIWWLVSRARQLTLPAPGTSRWPLILARAVMEVLATIAFLIALVRVPFAEVSAVMQSLPLMVTLGAALFLGERVGWRRWVAILVGLMGVLVIIRPGHIGFQPAVLLVVVSVIFAAARDLITRVMPVDVHSFWIMVATGVTVAMFGILATTSLDRWEPVSISQLFMIFAAASFLLVAYLFIILAMRVGEVAVVTPFRYTSLLWAILFGYLVFAEVPDELTLLGALIIVSTGLFAWYRERRLSR